MDRTTPTQVYTYADLRRIHLERLEAAQKSKQEIRNHSSALTQFAGVAGKADFSPCDQDFTDRFEISLTRFVDYHTMKGTSTATVANKLSYIRAIRKTFATILSGVVPTGGFRTSLMSLMQDNGVTQVELAKAVGVKKQSIHDWTTRGKVPNELSLDVIRRIESFFNISPGSLLKKVEVSCSVYSAPDHAPPKLASRAKRYALSLDHFRYQGESKRIRAEWCDLVKFYTAPYLLNGLERNTTWRVKNANTVTTKCGWEAKTPDGVCVTARIRWVSVATFFGFLMRSSDLGGKGMQEEQLSLALLSDAKLTVDFIEFKKLRSGRYTGETERILAFLTSLLRPKTGFLWQQPEYGDRLPQSVSKEEWHRWCDENSKTLRTIASGLKKGGHIQKGREPKEPIAAILAEAHPVQVLIKMTERMNQQFTFDVRRNLVAIRKRNLLLVKMLISNPLRVHNYSIMSYHKDNSGNLYQDAAGVWRLRFRPEDFKNQRGAASKEYDVILPEWLYYDIQEYLEQYRPCLALADVSDRVFLPGKQGGRGNNQPYWQPNKITGCLHKITKTFINGSPGFGAHAFRHIVATDYIKNNPQGFQVAASILHDRLDTVMREYAHIKVADGFSHWSTYLDTQICAVMEDDHE